MKTCFILFLLLPRIASYEAKVVAVLDGDTIEVLKDQQVIRIRLSGIDAPEKGQPFGTKAKQFTSDLLYGKTVKVVAHSTDRYGRIIADIYVGPINAPDEYTAWFNKAIILAGYAWHYKQYSDDKALAQAETDARNLKLGLWVDKDPIPPWEWRQRSK